jgi:hypothetical protein
MVDQPRRQRTADQPLDHAQHQRRHVVVALRRHRQLASAQVQLKAHALGRGLQARRGRGQHEAHVLAQAFQRLAHRGTGEDQVGEQPQRSQRLQWRRLHADEGIAGGLHREHPEAAQLVGQRGRAFERAAAQVDACRRKEMVGIQPLLLPGLLHAAQPCVVRTAFVVDQFNLRRMMMDDRCEGLLRGPLQRRHSRGARM